MAFSHFIVNDLPPQYALNKLIPHIVINFAEISFTINGFFTKQLVIQIETVIRLYLNSANIYLFMLFSHAHLVVLAFVNK